MIPKPYRQLAFATVSVAVAACDGGSAPDTTSVARAVALVKSAQASAVFSCGFSGPKKIHA